MLKKKIFTAISAVIALGMSSSTLAEKKEEAKTENTSMQMASLPGTEKCYGIAKAHQNDCGTANHNCAGEAKINNDKKEWLAVPTGLCTKIAGGSLKDSQDA